jgi:hypothetical protein
MSENDLTDALRSILTDARYAVGQLRRDRPDPRRALDALERIAGNAESALRPADATPAAGSCEFCPAQGGGCIMCNGIQAKAEGGR